MEQNYQKKSYALFGIWSVFFIAVMTVCAVWRPNIAGFGVARSVSLILCILLDTLFLLIYLTESIYWISGVTYEEAVKATGRQRRRYAMRHLASFLAATVVYALYCLIFAQHLQLGNVWDSLIAAGLVCIAVIATMQIRL